MQAESYSKEFQLFVQNVLIDDLQKEKFKLLCFHLEVPRRTLDNADRDRTEMLWYLKEQCLIEKWRKEPALLECILSSVLKRIDLVNKLRELVGENLCMVTEFNVYKHFHLAMM